MDWENETYVRFYVRDTVTWLSWPWESRCVFGLLLRKLDRAGVLDLSGRHEVDAVSAITMLPREFVALGLPPILDSGAVILDGDRLLAPKYIPAQEARSSNAQRARLHRAKVRAMEKKDRNDSLRKRNAPKTTPAAPASRKQPVRGKSDTKATTDRNDSLRDRHDSLRERNDPPGARNATLRNATLHNAEKKGAAAPSSSNGFDPAAVQERRKASQKRRRGKRGTGEAVLDDRPSDPLLFALPVAERKALAELLALAHPTKPQQAERERVLGRIEEEVIRVFKVARHKATGLDFPVLRGADSGKWRKAARKFGSACIAYGLTPERVMEHWAVNNFTEQRFPSLMWMASESLMDQAAMALLPTRGPSRKKGPMEAVSGKDWENFEDDYERLVSSHPK